ncbi:C40 family peptidase [Cohnella abietis]|uniref:NlpC/P60 domain-containing protein n=1 Tax=Cohnella abietis TaxID=2507935 RepID=A0A3T1D2Q3_9BACL|nr:C40 family peptidase [Cohnella abietis]BBI32386.1 hypothetical protein KCTCHS21_17850 [Cohnella abietis]
MNVLKRKFLLLVAGGILLLTGCVHNPGDTTIDLKRSTGPVKVQSNGASPSDLTEGRHIVPIRQLQHTGYISLEDLTKATGYRGAWLRDGSYGVGDHDAAWIFKAGQTTVSIAGKKMRMPASAIKEGELLYIPVSALQKLYGDVTVFRVETDDIAFFPKPTPNETGASGKSLNFSNGEPNLLSQSSTPAETAAAKDSKGDNVITFAKKYLGVKYEFGTGKYSETGNFDCSSFTQYVFNHFNVDLPRVAQQQADGGTYIARDNLRAGDLMFFYVPGRFKSNDTVGHVGIYMGDENMIHASPLPEDGVQVTPINKAYWKETFMYAKRFPL